MLRFPGSPYGLPLPIWLQLGRDYPLPVGVLGVLNDLLRERWEARVNREWFPVYDPTKDNHIFHEEVTLAPWLKLHLNSLKDVLSRVAEGELIFTYIYYHPVI